jgi:hypothetical protein
MSGLQQHIEQPLALPPCAISLEGSRPRTQPTGSRRPRRLAGVFEESYGQKINGRVPTGCATKGLETAYVMENRRAVSAFIEESRLRGLLSQALGALDASFGKAAIKKLTLMCDDEGFQALSCLVLVPGDMQEARRALRSFDQQWWLTHSEHAAGRLNFDFELV